LGIWLECLQHSVSHHPLWARIWPACDVVQERLATRLHVAKHGIAEVVVDDLGV